MRNPRFLPGEQPGISQPVGFSREKATGMPISARTPIGAQAGEVSWCRRHHCEALTRWMYWIGTIDEAHTITRGCVFSASALDTIGPQLRYEMAHWTISLTRRACFFLWCALRRFFCFGPRYNRPSAALRNGPLDHFAYAPPLNLSWRQAS